ncbi:MAG: Ig-like domain-containing protein [Atopobiaceae bacterium]|nr:Ig-like domain-containing protein [Atopobiaceae bacterium]
MVTSFALNDTTLSLTPGSSSRLLPTIPNPSNANLLMATWATSNPNVALVLGDGTVLAVGEGQATITCTMRGVTQTCAVTVGPDTRPQSIKGAVVAAIEDQECTGTEITPTPTVTLGDVTLTKDVDYELSYVNNVEEGQATITVTGIGGYYGTVTSTFSIIERRARYKGQSGRLRVYDLDSPTAIRKNHTERRLRHREQRCYGSSLLLLLLIIQSNVVGVAMEQGAGFSFHVPCSFSGRPLAPC